MQANMSIGYRGFMLGYLDKTAAADGVARKALDEATTGPLGPAAGKPFEPTAPDAAPVADNREKLLGLLKGLAPAAGVGAGVGAALGGGASLAMGRDKKTGKINKRRLAVLMALGGLGGAAAGLPVAGGVKGMKELAGLVPGAAGEVAGSIAGKAKSGYDTAKGAVMKKIQGGINA